MLTVTIGGVDRTALVRTKELIVAARLTSEPDSCRFPLVSADGSYEPAINSEVIVTNEAGARVFGGILNQTRETAAGATRRFDCECVDFTAELDRRLIVESYSSQTAGAIVQDFIAKVNEYQPAGKLFTTTNVQTGPTITQFKANYQPASLLMEKLYRLTGYEWYADYSRDIHFFAVESKTAPVNLNPRASWSQDGEWWDLEIRRGPVSQIRNRVYVRGAVYEGTEMILRFAGDGKQRVWYLGYLARGVAVYVNAVGPKLLGLDNVDSAKQYYHNYDGMFVRQDDSETVLTSSDELQVVFTPLIPVRVVVQDEGLVNSYGVREHLIQDQSIDTKELARLRGKLEVRDQGASGSFKSLVTGWHPGQSLTIALPARGLSSQKALITRTNFQYAGNLNKYVTTVEWEAI